MSNNDQIHTLGEVSRALFDGHDDAVYSNEFEYGVSESVVRKIWEQNKEPVWMLEKRLASLKVFQEKAMPKWGPDLSKLDLSKICYYARPEGASNAKSWDDVPDKIKNTFERLGIPEAERTMLAGVGAQYDSEVVYHNLRQELRDQWVIFEDMSVAVRDHAELVQKYFMKLIPATDHIFAALHGAVWSGGTFLYVPRGVEISDPLQAYFRMNVKSGGQFEHTLMIIEDEATAHYIEGCSAPKYDTPSLHAGMVEIFVGKKAKMRYTSVENWSIDTYNLNTKRSVVQEEGYMEWVGGNFGSGVTMLYPCTILQGRKSSCDHLGVAFANAGQNVDGGAKVIHIGEDTSSNVIMKSSQNEGDSRPIVDYLISNRLLTMLWVASTVMLWFSILSQKMIRFLISVSAMLRLSVLMRRVLVVSVLSSSTTCRVEVLPRIRQRLWLSTDLSLLLSKNSHSNMPQNWTLLLLSRWRGVWGRYGHKKIAKRR
jgi:Fe-S cluster assembly protein SufB